MVNFINDQNNFSAALIITCIMLVIGIPFSKLIRIHALFSTYIHKKSQILFYHIFEAQ